MTVEVNVDQHAQIHANQPRLDAPIALVVVLHVMEDAHRVMIYARAHVRAVALQDVAQAVLLPVNQMHIVVVLYLLVLAPVLHVHLVAMGRAVIIVKVLIFQRVHQLKIQVHRVQHAELPVVLTVVKFALVVMAVVVVNA